MNESYGSILADSLHELRSKSLLCKFILKPLAMKMLLIFLLCLYIPAQSQTTKKVLIEGDGAPVVMLSGGTADMSVFNVHSKELSRNYSVIRMEQFNIQYAASGSLLPKNYSVSTESEAIGFTLDSLHISEPIILVGHSYGGLIAFCITPPRSYSLADFN